MRSPSPELMILVCCAGFATLAAGCQTTTIPKAGRPSVKQDPCAERLHDICGHLLLYHSAYKKLPRTLDVFGSAGGSHVPLLQCPRSGKPYVYDPTGLTLPGRKGRFVLYDPQPSHSGMRWGVLVAVPADGANITARVILVAEVDLNPAGDQP